MSYMYNYAMEDEKKKPGRPPKKPACDPLINIQGIAKEPQNAASYIELVHSNPAMFKKIFLVCLKYEMSQVEFHFDETGLSLIGADPTNNVRVVFRVNGNCLYHYYCAAPHSVIISMVALDAVFSLVSKENTAITMFFNQDRETKMYFALYEAVLNNPNLLGVNVTYLPNGYVIPADDEYNDADYPLVFTLPYASFKAKVIVKKAFGTTLGIEKSGTEPLQLISGNPQIIDHMNSFTDPDKIGLVWTGEDSVLRVTIFLEHVKPIAAVALGKNVVIAVHKTKRMSFTTCIDPTLRGNTCDVKVFCDLKTFDATEVGRI